EGLRDRRRPDDRLPRRERPRGAGAAADGVRVARGVPQTLAASEVAAVRSRIARAHALAAARFRETFVAGDTRAEAHLEIQAAALLEAAECVRLLGTIRYDVVDRLATPYVE